MAEDDVERAFGELSEVIGSPLSHAELTEIAHLGMNIVLGRTKQGIDAGGQAFKAYTPEYAAARAEAGYRPSPPDLARKGHMVGGMAPEVTGHNEVTVSFPSEHEAIKAAVHNDGPKSKRGKNDRRKQREFLDIRLPREMDLMGDEISEIFARRAR